MNEKRKRGRPRKGLELPNVDTPQGLRVAIAWAARQMIAEKLPVEQARVLGYLAGAMNELMKTEQAHVNRESAKETAREFASVVQASEQGVDPSGDKSVPQGQEAISDGTRRSEELQDGVRQAEDRQGGNE